MLNPLLFTIALEELSREIRSGCPEKLLYADDLALVRETHGRLKGRLGAKLMMNSENPRKDTVESKFPCTVCRKEQGNFAGIACVRDLMVLEVN